MQALVDSHIFVRKMEARDLFRAAYMKKYGKDMPPDSLEADLDEYLRVGKVPNYLVDFMIAEYGAH